MKEGLASPTKCDVPLSLAATASRLDLCYFQKLCETDGPSVEWGGAAWKDLLGDPIMVTRTPWTNVAALRDKGVYWPQPREAALGPPKARDGAEAQGTGCLGCGAVPSSLKGQQHDEKQKNCRCKLSQRAPSRVNNKPAHSRKLQDTFQTAKNQNL